FRRVLFRSYTDVIGFDSIRHAAETASHIARSGNSKQPASVNPTANASDLYAVEVSVSSIELKRKIDLIERGDKAAREYDRRIREVQSSVNDEMKYVMIASSDGRLTGDVQPLARFGISCIADDDGNLQVGRSGGGGRVGI